MANVQRINEMSAGTKLIFAAIMAAVLTPSNAAVAQYPYCYIDYDGLRSCSFRTLQECYQIRVGTGMCVDNPYYGTTRKPRRFR